MLQHVEDHDQILVGHVGQQPVAGDKGAPGLARGGGVGHLDPLGRGKGLLPGHGRGGRPGFEAVEVGPKQAQALIGIVVAGKEETAVAGVVVGLVKILESIKCQRRDHLGVAAGVHAVGGVGKKRALAEFAEHGIGRGVDALHFIEDHAAADQLAAVIPFKMPAFLEEDGPGDAGKKHGVKIDVNQIIEVAQVGGGHRVAGFVGVGEGVEKGVERPFEEFDKGFLDGVFLRSAQDRVFEDMGHAGGAGGRGTESRAENLVFVVGNQGQEFGPGAVVAVEDGPGGVFFNDFVAKDGKTVFLGHQRSCVGLGWRSWPARFFVHIQKKYAIGSPRAWRKAARG